jgi:hypothetical protein
VGKLTDELIGVEVMGPFYYAQFPTRCIKCGTSTSRTLPITKLFWRPSTTDRPAYYVIGEVAVMFAQSNANRKWDPISAQARMAARARWALLIGFLLPGLYLILKDLFH